MTTECITVSDDRGFKTFQVEHAADVPRIVLAVKDMEVGIELKGTWDLHRAWVDGLAQMMPVERIAGFRLESASHRPRRFAGGSKWSCPVG